MSNVDWNFGDLIDESVERSGLDSAALTHRHLASINRSLQLLLIDLENRGANAEFRMETKSYLLASTYGGVVLESDTIDVTQASILYNPGGGQKPYPLGRTTREDYQNLAFPTANGTPSVYWLSKSNPSGDVLPIGVTAPPATTDTPVLFVWPQNGLPGTVYVQVTRMRQHAMPSNFGAALDTRRAWLPTICAGLAARIAEKYNPEIEPQLTQKYERALLQRDAEEDHHPVVVAFRGHGYGRGRRH